MAEVIETIVFVLVFVGFLLFTLSVAIKDMREAKAERKDCQKFRHSVVESLDKLNYLVFVANNCKSLTYVQELRLHHTCIHCELFEDCYAAANQPENLGVVFDYLVCENFKE